MIIISKLRHQQRTPAAPTIRRAAKPAASGRGARFNLSANFNLSVNFNVLDGSALMPQP
jgi:hypothetical protein